MIKIILSALNEAPNLKILLPEIAQTLQKLGHNYEIILCLDGGSDNSEELILALKKSYPIRILEITNQKGLGCAYKRLFKDVINNSDDQDLIISLDADNTHKASQMAEIINYFNKNSLDILVASRFMKNSKTSGFPLYRKLISKVTSITLQTIFGIKKINGQKLKDYSSGYRVYKAQKLKELYQKYGENFIIEQNFVYTCEILLKLNKIGTKFDEIGLIYNYDQKIGETKLKITKNAESLLKLIFRAKFYKND